MNQRLRSTLRTIFPDSFLYRLLVIYTKIKTDKVRKIFEQAPEKSSWLGWTELESLQGKYPFPPMVSYDPDSLEKRGAKRAEEILRFGANKRKQLETFLDLGCWDGMVCCALHRMGKSATGIDIRSEGFDDRAVREGVTLLQMDATNLEFEDESFDFVFSYGSFEHFSEPELVLQEAIRVLRKGGLLYLDFGALYMAPQGLHAYRSITVPYRQILFPKDLLGEFVKAKGLPSIDFDSVNGWSLEKYRKLWDRYSHRLKKLHYYEIPDLSHLDLIAKYTSCFKGKTESFDNLIITAIRVLSEKIK